MAALELSFRKDLEHDPRVLALATATRLSVDDVLGKIYRLWCWVDSHADHGVVETTLDWVDAFTGQPGFGTALLHAKFLEADLTRLAFLDGVANSARLLRRRGSRGALAHADRLDRQAVRGPSFPPALDHPRFHAQWAEWLSYRKEKGRPLTAATVRQQLGFLEGMGLDDACFCIGRSIFNGWVGLFDHRRLGLKPKSDAEQQAQRQEEQRRNQILLAQQEARQRAQDEIDRVRRERIDGQSSLGGPRNGRSDGEASA